MAARSESRIGGILARANGGDADAWDELFSIVWEEWHALARAKMRREARPHTLETSALVNEAWMRIQREGRLDYENTRHLHGAVDRFDTENAMHAQLPSPPGRAGIPGPAAEPEFRG